MRTTLDLPDPLFRTLKARAALEGVPMKRVLQRLVEAGLAGPAPAATTASRPAFPSISTGGAVIGPFSNAALFELLADEDLEPREA